MCAIDLQLRTKKKIKILYTLSYNDLVWDGKDNLFMDQLPEFKFKNISYVLKYKNNKKFIIIEKFINNKNYRRRIRRLL